MYSLRSYATAFLQCNNKFLLFKRDNNKQIAANVWSGIGGHIEPCEINSPRQTCLREIKEETGILESEITNLQLRYILIRMSKTEIRHGYIYFGNTTNTNDIETNEGILHRVGIEQLPQLQFSQTHTALLEHYISTGSHNSNVYTAVAECKDKKLSMNWSILKDFEFN